MGNRVLPIHARTIVLAVALIILGSCPAFCSDELFYVLNVQMYDAISTISLNGVPIAECNPKRKPCGGTGVMLNPWMKSGENELLLSMPKVRGNLTMKLYAGRDGQRLEDSKPLIEFDIKDYPDTSGPLIKRFSFTPKAKFPSLEVWNKTSVVKLDENAKSEIRTLVMNFAKACATLNASRIAAFKEFSVNEQNRATYQKPQSRAAIANYFEKEMINDLREQKAKIKPIDQTALEFKPLAGGRIVKVTGKDGSDPIEFLADNKMVIAFEIYVGYVGGKWLLVQ